MPYLRAISAFRDSVRKLAMEGAPASEILALSDQFRDYDAVDLGIALDDQAGTSLLLSASRSSLTLDRSQTVALSSS